MLTFGRYLALVMMDAHKTIDQVAAAVHVSEDDVAAWMNNRAVPTEEQLEELGFYFGPDSCGKHSRMPEPEVRPHYRYRDRSKLPPGTVY